MMMDIEDAYKLKLLNTAETKELFSLFLNEKQRARSEEVYQLVTDANEQIAYLRSSVIGILVRECTATFVAHEQEILDGTFQDTLIEQIDEPYRQAYEACAALSMKRIYRSRPVVDVELAGFRVISTLISLMIEAVQSPEKAYSKLLIDRVSSQYSIRGGSLYDRILAVLDYISGMTDVYALDLYRKINGESLPAV
jgi:dGTPase